MTRPEPWLMALVAKNGLDNLCRVCLASGNADLGYTLINIFEPPNQDTASGFSKADVLHTICDIELSEDDHLPKRICPVCFSRLDDAYNLRQQSQTTQQTLYEVLAEVTSASENAARNNVNQLEHEVGKLFERSKLFPKMFLFGMFPISCFSFQGYFEQLRTYLTHILPL
ncbi:uncharacterized protein LOC134287897 [Aedes albopictus]|uniref:ZAD domain-containing protein n=1 Tax=Aedes albopictus TaxID=7160 RepID=A0ABM1XKS6_AEDAL